MSGGLAGYYEDQIALCGIVGYSAGLNIVFVLSRCLQICNPGGWLVPHLRHRTCDCPDNTSHRTAQLTTLNNSLHIENDVSQDFGYNIRLKLDRTSFGKSLSQCYLTSEHQL